MVYPMLTSVALTEGLRLVRDKAARAAASVEGELSAIQMASVRRPARPECHTMVIGHRTESQRGLARTVDATSVGRDDAWSV